MQKKMRTSFEVVSDVLYLDGNELHYGDVLNPLELGARMLDLLALEMIRPLDPNRLHRYASSLNSLA